MATTTAPQAALDKFTEELIAAIPKLDETEQRIGVALFRRLALGEPVEVSSVASDLGLPEDRVADLLDRMPGVYRDDEERIVGYFGLTIVEMGDHRIHLDGRELSAWCAWDTLFIPEMLGRSVEVTSRSPDAGDPISLTAGPDGPRNVTPAEAVVSFVPISSDFVKNTIAAFCHYVHFFPSPEAAAPWVAKYEGAFVLPIEEAYKLGEVLTQTAFGTVIPARS